MAMRANVIPRGKLVENCHMCKSAGLVRVLDLGFHPHSDYFPTDEQLNEHQEHYPLRLVSCSACGLLQIDYFVHPRILYQQDYLYQSSTTDTGRAHYREMANEICNLFSAAPKSLVVDIGSNVGVLLQGFKELGLTALGVDPAEAAARQAIQNGIETIIDFFDSGTARTIREKFGPARIITGTNVFAHLHEIDDAVEGMKVLLARDGVIAIEAPYALDLIRNLEYDTIYHQHIGYLSVRPMQRYFKKFGLELFDLKKMPIHGGSVRYYVGHCGQHPVSPEVAAYVADEEALGLYSLETLRGFAERVARQKMALVDLLSELKRRGKKIVGVSAPAKGNTLLNYCHISTSLVDFITEKNPLKVGRYTPGTYIPIYGDERIIAEKPDYALILAWNFSEEIMRNMSAYKKAGGKFIIPIPEPKIV